MTKAWAEGGADAAVGGAAVHDGGAGDEGHMAVREHVGAGDGAGVELRGGEGQLLCEKYLHELARSGAAPGASWDRGGPRTLGWQHRGSGAAATVGSFSTKNISGRQRNTSQAGTWELRCSGPADLAQVCNQASPIPFCLSCNKPFLMK